MLNESFYIDIGRVSLAHEFTLVQGNRCDYSQGRKVNGISLALDGEAEYRTASGKKIKIKAGDVVFLPALSAYALDISDSYHHYTVNFALHGEYSNTTLYDDITVLHTENLQYFRTAFSRLCEVWKEKKSGYQMRSTMYVYRLCEAFITEINTKNYEGNHTYHSVAKAKEYIDKNYAKNITIGFLARLCDMSETNFRRRFLALFGETPMAYRDKVRLQNAKELLEGGFCSVGEVALKCGFDDVSYFCRFFKKHTKITPLEFMKNGI